MLNMSHTVSSAVGGNDSKNHRNSTAKVFRNGPVCASEEHFKDALLESNDDCHDSGSCQQGQHKILRRVWHWSVRNVTIIALVCLVIGGLVTILVSFEGCFLRPLLGSELKFPSVVLSKAYKACVETDWYMSYSCVCTRCIGDIAEFVT